MPRYILDPEWEVTRPIGSIEGTGMTRYIDELEQVFTKGSRALPVRLTRPYGGYMYWLRTAPEVMEWERKIARAKPSTEGLGWWDVDAAGQPVWKPGPPPWAGRRGFGPRRWCPFRKCQGPGRCPYCKAFQAYQQAKVSGLGDTTSRGRIEELHCLLKHLLNAEGHAEESIANYARRRDEKAVIAMANVLDQVRRVRQNVFASLYRDGEAELQLTHASAGCARCEADLQQGLGVCPSCLVAMLAL